MPFYLFLNIHVRYKRTDWSGLGIRVGKDFSKAAVLELLPERRKNGSKLNKGWEDPSGRGRDSRRSGIAKGRGLMGNGKLGFVSWI